MRWLWSPRTDGKVFDEASGQRSPEVVAPDYSASNVNPLAQYGISLQRNKVDLLLFGKYTDLTKLAHRQRKRRKRYAFYRSYYQLTHYRLPSIDSRSAPDDVYSNYVLSFQTAKFQPQDPPSKWHARESNTTTPVASALKPSASFAHYQREFELSPPPHSLSGDDEQPSNLETHVHVAFPSNTF